MSDPLKPLSDFADLRRVGIEYAQQASGQIWTDYNLHDPGVTLLEQTCFALSQIAYQVSRPTRDLLTDAQGHFCAQDLALFKPRRVLSTSPVTRHDLAAWLCSCPQIDSVSISPPDPHRTGLYDITIVPADGAADPAEAEAAFRNAFAEVRPLCTALGQVRIARPIDVDLRGRVEISSETLPESTAAALYLAVGRILTGSDAHAEAATRADVWDAPERLLAPAQNRSAVSLDLSRYLARLQQVQGVRDISNLALAPLAVAGNASGSPAYFRVRLPEQPDEIHLDLRMDDAPVSVSLTRLREEYVRLAAEAIATATHHIDRPDWDVMRAGRHRRFTHAHVDALLPALYRIPHEDRAQARGIEKLFKQYRGGIEAQLSDMVTTLSTLPDRFSADPGQPESDPVRHRLRVRLLDYLIALQGCEMPATRHSALHHYMSTTERHRFEISWRLGYLFALPALHRARATGPGPKSPGGFLAELALLCDIGLTKREPLAAALADYGLTPDPQAEILQDAEAEDLVLVPAHNPFDMLVPDRKPDEILTPEALRDLSPFLEDDRINPDMLGRLADPDAFAIAPDAGGRWQILLDPGGAQPLRRIGRVDDKQDAMRTVTALRGTWRYLNRACEAACLIEHLSCSSGGTDVPFRADLVLPGFTARASLQSFRAFVEGRVRALAPAHIHVRVLWLAPSQMQNVSSLLAAAQGGSTVDRTTLLACLDAIAAKARI